MPNTSREIRGQLGLDKARYGYIPDTIVNMLPPGHKIGKVSPLFAKIDDQLIEELREKYGGKQETNGAAAARSKTESVESSKASVAQQVNFLYIYMYMYIYRVFQLKEAA